MWPTGQTASSAGGSVEEIDLVGAEAHLWLMDWHVGEKDVLSLPLQIFPFASNHHLALFPW